MDQTSARRQVRIFKALMHPVRLQILDLLRHGDLCVCQIEAQLGQRQAYVSQQLAVLRRVGLIADWREGLNIYYRLVEPQVLPVLDAVRAIVGDEPSTLPSATPPRCAATAPARPAAESSAVLTSEE
ncbi:MAG: ArsR/SmtB family transcription factor [Chloroflexaceae bacterium]